MRWQGWVVLVSAGVQVSTEQVYGRWQPQLASAASESPAEQLTERQSAAALGALLRNDLESAVFAVSPVVKRTRDDLVAMGLANARVTGAGSVVYGVFDRRAEAEAFAEKVDLNMPSRPCFVAPAPCPST